MGGSGGMVANTQNSGWFPSSYLDPMDAFVAPSSFAGGDVDSGAGGGFDGPILGGTSSVATSNTTISTLNSNLPATSFQQDEKAPVVAQPSTPTTATTAANDSAKPVREAFLSAGTAISLAAKNTASVVSTAANGAKTTGDYFSRGLKGFSSSTTSTTTRQAPPASTERSRAERTAGTVGSIAAFGAVSSLLRGDTRGVMRATAVAGTAFAVEGNLAQNRKGGK